MDTKEAIEIVNDKLVHPRAYEVTKLLQQGEKYRLMWGGIATMYKLPCYGLENSSGLDIVKHLEQKYFPKETNEYKEGDE